MRNNFDSSFVKRSSDKKQANWTSCNLTSNRRFPAINGNYKKNSNSSET